MFDFDACPRSSSKWTNLTWAIANFLTSPIPLHVRGILLALLVASIFWILWKFRQSRWHKRFKRLQRLYWRQRWVKVALGMVIVSLVTATAPSVTVAAQVLAHPIPQDSGLQADAIVVLGRGMRLAEGRIAVATTLWQANRAPKIFVSGIVDAQQMAEQFIEHGVPETAIAGEGCSLTTEENAQYTANKLLPNHSQRIILVTDPPHMLRSLLTFNSLGFEVIPHLAPLPADLGERETAVLWLREYGGLMSYALLGRLTDRNQAIPVS